jgi:hypothetical protein
MEGRMKSFWITVGTMLWTAIAGAQVVILAEDFEGANPPAGWALSQNTPSVGWQFGANLGSEYLPIPGHTIYAASNDDAYDDGSSTLNLADRDRLITPVLDLTPYSATGVVLEFAYVQPGTYGSSGSVEVSTDGGTTWNEVEALTAAADWTNAQVDLSAFTASSTVRVAFRHNDGGNWGDGFAIDDVIISSVPGTDVSVDEITVAEYVAVGPIDISATITNQGSIVVTSVNVVYQVDSGPGIPATINGLNVGLGESVEVVHPTPYHFASAGESEVEFSVVGVNGGADADPSDNLATKTIGVLTLVPIKHVVLEVHTGSWCGWCPDGTVRMDEVEESVANVITVAVHNGDGMDIPDGNTISGTFIGGYPSGTVDRFRFDGQSGVEVSRNSWLTRVNERAGHIVPVEVSIVGSTFNEVTRELEVEVGAEFVGSAAGDLRLNCWVVEDSVTGSGSDYDQANYLNSDSGHPFFGAGNPIIGFEHNRVLRSMLGGPWGTAGIIPAMVAPGQTFSHIYTTTIPAGQNVAKMTVVGMVSAYNADVNRREIINAVEAPASPSIFADGFEIGDVSDWSSATQ